MKKTAFAHFMRNNVRSISPKNRINFFRQMAILTKAGVSLLDTLKLLKKSARGHLKQLVTDIVENIEQGNNFSTIGKYYVKFFDKTMLSMIKAGENSGTLPDSMQQIYENLKRSSEFSRKIKGAMIMPIITFVLAIGVVFFMALHVIPSFSEFLSSMGADMPALTQAIVTFSDFVIAKWKNILTYSIVVIVTFMAAYKFIIPFKNMMHHIFLKTPLIGPIILYSTLSNFSNSMSRLLGSGVGVIDSIQISNESSKLLPLRKVVNRAIKIVTSGGDISTSFYEARFIPPIFCDLLKSGEMSGTLDNTFKHLSEIYREEADHKVSALQVAIQPIMTILIGGIVGVVAGGLILGMVALWAGQGS